MSKKSSLFYFIFLILYLELFSKIIITKSFTNIGITFLFSIPFILIIYFICNIFNEKINKFLSYLITIILVIYYNFTCIFYRLFSNIFSFNTLGLAKNITEFKNMIYSAIIDNIYIIILLLIPLIFLIMTSKKINFKRTTLPKIIIIILLIPTSYIISILLIIYIIILVVK